MKDFSAYNFITDSIFVTDSNNEICYTNFAFKENFKNAHHDINKLIQIFDFDICILDNSKIMEVTPLSLAIQSTENYACSAINVQTGLECEIFKSKSDNCNIFVIKPKKQNIKMFDDKIKELESENKKAEQLKNKAQTQAAKIALLNRIYTITQKENDFHNTLKHIFEELNSMFGVDKLFFAQKNDNDFIIENIFPAEYKYALNEKIEYKSDINGVYEAQNYIKDFDFFKEPSLTNNTRILVPVQNQNNLFGILCFTLSQKNFKIIAQDFLNSLCSQLSTAILQTILSQQLKENQLQLINSEKMATLGNMIAAVAHEINTPLGSINSNNEILTKLIEKNINESSSDTKNLTLITTALNCDKEAIKRIMSIVKALKKFIRLDEAKMQLTDVSSEIDLTLDLCQHMIKNRITVIKNYNDVPKIYTHPNMLNQVFMNLITNAAQSIKEKGEIIISTNCDNNNLIISVKDNGEGIKEEIKSKIFQQGFTTKPKDSGTGLGLSISKKIIEQLGGEIYFTSKENEGSEFFVKLPYKEINNEN